MRRPVASPAAGRAGSGGFVALALVALLLAGSTATLLFGHRPGPVASGPARALEDVRRLAAARDALLAYAATYPERYGPTGAGPGHLPCPDTDATFRLAGPNPPCGRGAVAEGRLPAHVTVDGTRTGLDLAPDGVPIRYRLDTRVANNPARRPVAFGAGRAGASRIVAELSLPAPGGGRHALRIDGAALADAAELGTVAWFASHAAPVLRCGAEPVPSATDAASPRVAVDALALVTRRAPTSGRGACEDGETGELDDGDGGVAVIEGVPQARHWFALDAWAGALHAPVAPACRVVGTRCAWRIDARARRTARRAASPDGAPQPLIEVAFVPVDGGPAGGEPDGGETNP